MASAGSATTYNWTCPDCARPVPKAIHMCRCGHRAVAATPGDVAVTEALALFDSEAPIVEPAPIALPGGRVTIGHDDLAAVVLGHGLNSSDADRIWKALCERGAERQRFDEVRVLHYVVALIVISAMGFVMTLAWTAIGGVGLVLFAAASGLAFWLAGESIWKRGISTPGGLFPRFAEARRDKEGARSDVT
jgi:hypothetical protein